MWGVMSELMGYRGGANCRCDCDGYRPDKLGGGTWHAVSHRRWDKLMIKALGTLFGLCVLLMLLLIYVATDIDSQAHFDRLVEHFSQ